MPSEPTAEQRAEWKRLCGCLAAHLMRPLLGHELTEEVLACAVPALLAALDAAEEQAARWKIEAGVQGIARADAERHRDLLRGALAAALAGKEVQGGS